MTDAANMKTNEVSQQNEKRKGAANNKKGTAKKKRSKEQMEKDREKMKRYRKRQMYEKQIETLEGDVGKVAEKVNVWVGDRETGSFQKLTQVTRMANVRNMSPFLHKKTSNQQTSNQHHFEGLLWRWANQRTGTTKPFLNPILKSMSHAPPNKQ